MTRPFLFIKPCHAEAWARPENIPRKILENFLCLRPLFKYICLTNAATLRGTGHLYMRPKNRSLWLAILICLLGGHFPARAQSHSVSAIEMAARMRRDYPFRCNISGRVFATDEFHEKPFPLAGASVRAYCLEDSATLKSTAVSFDSGHFNADIWDKKRHGRPQVRLTITYVGMDTLDCVVAAQKEDDQFGPAYAVTLDSVVLRSHPITLEETQIIAELKKTYLRGDTTVFNVDAFDMPEGTVLDTINKLLAFSRDERFACIDICSVDLNTGGAEFVKIGSPVAVILRDGKVRVLESGSLPMGILDTLRPAVAQEKLSDGDMLVFMSDGITSAFGSTPELIEFLQPLKPLNPQNLADKLLAAALERTGGKAEDDMTVLCTRIFQTAAAAEGKDLAAV